MKIVAGVDGGGTRTRIALADSEGNLRGIGISGPSNYGSTSLDDVRNHIQEAFTTAVEQAGVNSNDIDALFMGMAGVVSESDRNVIHQLMKDFEIINPKKIEIDHDIRISLAGGLAGKPGIALIAGTGSSCYGRNVEGNEWMSGGWGHVVDDKGSAYDLARQSLIALVRAEDRRGEPTILSKMMVEGLKIENVKDIMRRLYFEGFRGKGYPMSKEELASLAPRVIEAAESGDKVAMQIVAEGVNELVLMVNAVANSIDFQNDSIPIIVTGGLVQQSEYYQQKLFSALREEINGCRIVEPQFAPLFGGVLLAFQMLEIENPELVTDKLIVSNLAEFK